MHSPTLDPSALKERSSSKIGIDAKVPLGKKEEFMPVYTPGQDNECIEKILLDLMKDSKKYRKHQNRVCILGYSKIPVNIHGRLCQSAHLIYGR